MDSVVEARLEVAMKPKEAIKVVKTAARKMRVAGTTNDGDEVKRCVAPAEYAVLKDGQAVAVIVKAGDGWRCCRPSEGSRIGLAVSPIGTDTWGMVKKWALEEFA